MRSKATLKQVAALAGVSYQTVSKVLNGQAQVSPATQNRIMKAVAELGYRPNQTARNMRTGQSFMIGYSWPPSAPGQVNAILDQFLQAMFLAAEQHGYYLQCFPYHDDYQEHLATYSELMDTGRVDGFVLSSIEYDDPRVLLLQKRNFPFVAFGRSNPELVFPWIDIDGGLGISQAMHHLVQKGHRKIAALAWPEDSRVGNNRMEGYFSVLREVGIRPEKAWIKRGEGVFDFGYRATQELLDLPERIRPTALIALNDTMAIGALQAARAHGLRVGTDFAVAGFDDAPLVQYMDPPLTTVRQPIVEVGRRIIAMLLEYIDRGIPPTPISAMLAPQLIVRGSTTGEWSEQSYFRSEVSVETSS
jgi:DNA-binding LacI/PurR family transcriptional regulator